MWVYLLMKAAGVPEGKDECQVRLEGREREYWTSTETGMLGGCGLQGQIMAGECSDYKGKM